MLTALLTSDQVVVGIGLSGASWQQWAIIHWTTTNIKTIMWMQTQFLFNNEDAGGEKNKYLHFEKRAKELVWQTQVWLTFPPPVNLAHSHFRELMETGLKQRLRKTPLEGRNCGATLSPWTTLLQSWGHIRLSGRFSLSVLCSRHYSWHMKSLCNVISALFSLYCCTCTWSTEAFTSLDICSLPQVADLLVIASIPFPWRVYIAPPAHLVHMKTSPKEIK